MDKTIAITRTDEGIEPAVRAAFDTIGGPNKFIQNGDTVFIKPNLTGDRDPSTAAVTNPEVLKALIEYIQEVNPKDILLGDSPSWGFDAEKVYDVTGVREVAKKTGCTLVNLDKDEPVEVRIEGARVLKKTKVAKTVLNCDKIINVPVMKTHMQTMVTLGLKNMKGVLPLKSKARLHESESIDGYQGLDAAIADLHRFIRPALTFVDGTYAMEGRGPFDGDPVKMDLIIAGADAVLVDAVCAEIMGFDPKTIPSIRLCAEIDGIDLSDYHIVGPPIEAVKRNFKPCPTEIYEGDNIRIFAGQVCSGCLATLNTAIHRLQKQGELERINDLYLGIGKDHHMPIDVERCLYVGQCAFDGKQLQTKGRRNFVKGCPPTGWQIVEGIKGAGK